MIKKIRFQKRCLRSFYKRIIRTLLSRMLPGTMSDGIETHPTIENIVNMKYHEAEIKIRTFIAPEFCWKCRFTHQEQSLSSASQGVGAVSQKSFVPLSINLYPFCITILSPTKEWSQDHRINSESLPAYPPVWSSISVEEAVTLLHTKSRELSIFVVWELINGQLMRHCSCYVTVFWRDCRGKCQMVTD